MFNERVSHQAVLYIAMVKKFIIDLPVLNRRWFIQVLN